MRHEKLVSDEDRDRRSIGSREGMSNRVVCAEMHVRVAVEMLEGIQVQGVGEVVEALEMAQNFLEKVGMDSKKIEG